MITRAITANRPIDHHIIEIRSFPSTFAVKFIAQKSNQNGSTGFQPQTQSTSVILNPKINNTETTESISPTELNRISIPTSFALIPGITIQMHVPTKTI